MVSFITDELVKHFLHSNLGYALLGRVLAGKFSGTSYEFWLEQYVFSPLGMKNTGFNLDW